MKKGENVDSSINITIENCGNKVQVTHELIIVSCETF